MNFKYEEELKEIVLTIYNVHNDIDFHTDKLYLICLTEDIKYIKCKYKSTIKLSILDIEEQVKLIWLELMNTYRKTKPNTFIKTYLTRISCWRLRNWYKRESKIITNVPYIYNIDNIIKKESSFNLDLNFLLDGTSLFPLSELSGYERYLIFLKYKENKNNVDIAEIVQQERRTVSLYLNKITKKLRSLKLCR